HCLPWQERFQQVLHGRLFGRQLVTTPSTTQGRPQRRGRPCRVRRLVASTARVVRQPSHQSVEHVLDVGGVLVQLAEQLLLVAGAGPVVSQAAGGVDHHRDRAQERVRHHSASLLLLVHLPFPFCPSYECDGAPVSTSCTLPLPA